MELRRHMLFVVVMILVIVVIFVVVVIFVTMFLSSFKIMFVIVSSVITFVVIAVVFVTIIHLITFFGIVVAVDVVMIKVVITFVILIVVVMGVVEGRASFHAVEVLQGWGDESSRGIWNGTNYTFVLSTAQRVQRWMAYEGIRDTRAPAGGQRQRMDDAERDDIQDALDEEEGREGGAREGGVADEADEAVREPDLPGEEVAMTSRGVGRAGPAPRAPRPELDRARREKRTVGQAAVEVPDTGREKRARQTTIDEMYARQKLAEFTDAWLQWIYMKKLPFNAFRGPEFQRVR
ncbi:hypothetical protein CBR_g54436 [Chara braunii]|uniref:Uncharacterized protein n=1 Tax=Chara braunii TaxID=69332 RepID=A0A388MCA4_CHABU|nr:hypothetical protein CBR_g54436 [Chara braunii]|eukprot:GBG92135.1 hypothetical protein CBR_g54436 [Chara braunii]